MMSHSDRKTLGVFLVVTFSLTWIFAAVLVFFTDAVERVFGEVSASNPLFIIAVYAPAISSIILIVSSNGIKGLLQFLRRFLIWRMGIGWWAFLVFAIPFIFYLGAYFKEGGGNYFSFETFPYQSLSQAIPALLLALFLGPVEELGWRGLALPLLQRMMLPIWAGLLLGIVWATWHIPAFLMSGAPQSGWSFPIFFLGVVALSVIMTPLFNESRGSLLIAYLFHFQMMNPLWPDAQPYDTYLLLVIAGAILWFKRQSMFSTDAAVKDILGS